jgi:hypothetical protein
MLVVSWLLDREYRLHRLLDINLPETFSEWLATVDASVQRKGCETYQRIVKVVILAKSKPRHVTKGAL